MNSKLKVIFVFIFVLTGFNFLTAQEFKEVRKSFIIDKSGDVTLDTYKGKVTIEPSGSDVVEVYAKIEPDRGNFLGTGAKKQLANASVVFDASSNSVKIKSEYKHENDSWLGSNTMAFVNYKIKMPKTATLTVKDYKSDTNISGLESKIEFDTYKGEVRINGLSGSVNFETYKGEAEIRFDKLTGDSKFGTYKGDIAVSIPKSSAFTFRSDFGKRVDFENGFDIKRESYGKKSKSYNFSGDVNGGGPKIKISSEKGNIKLRAR